jgi:hypothetical protein
MKSYNKCDIGSRSTDTPRASPEWPHGGDYGKAAGSLPRQ